MLFEKAADELTPPASMSKIMTMVMVFEALKRGELSLDNEFHISEDAWRRGGATSGGSTMYAELNSSIRLEDLIKGVVIQSGNDACIAIAEGIAGSERAFADLMTQRARELGLEQSVFTNATGLPDPEHLVTMRELAKIAQHRDLQSEGILSLLQPDRISPGTTSSNGTVILSCIRTSVRMD